MEARLDPRYSAGDEAVPWREAERLLAEAELYWVSTVRPDGRPHVTPLVGVWVDGALHFTTGADEQKARNLAANPGVALTTGTNTWAAGCDVVVSGTAVRVVDGDVLQRLADGFRSKYGGDWDFRVDGDTLAHSGGRALAFAVAPDTVHAFGKDPHTHTRYTP